MGTVSGVYLKYVVLSAGFTSAGISYLTDEWKVSEPSLKETPYSRVNFEPLS
jgi:hypothetical protein